MRKLIDVEVPKAKGVGEVSAEETKRKPVGERIAEAKEDAIVLEATQQAYGLGQSGGAEKPESLAVQIVTNSMKQQAEAVKDMKENEKALQNEVKEAQATVGTMQTAMLKDMLERIEKGQTKLDESARIAQGTGAPMSAFDGYKQVKAELETLVSTIKQKEPESQKPGMSDATQIRLKELELEQNRVLTQITADNTRAQQQFQLQMLEFQDNKEIRRLEYQDKRRFREEGLQGVTDLVAAIGAGVSHEGGPVKEAAVTSKKVGEEVEAGAYISSFKCSLCGTEVPVQDGQQTATCPNPNCNAQFTIKAKE